MLTRRAAYLIKNQMLTLPRKSNAGWLEDPSCAIGQLTCSAFRLLPKTQRPLGTVILSVDLPASWAERRAQSRDVNVGAAASAEVSNEEPRLPSRGGGGEEREIIISF